MFPEDRLSDLQSLEHLRDALISAEPLKPQLDRNIQVLFPTEASQHTELPPEFFSLSAEELKREMQLRYVILNNQLPKVILRNCKRKEF